MKLDLNQLRKELFISQFSYDEICQSEKRYLQQLDMLAVELNNNDGIRKLLQEVKCLLNKYTNL
jgi:hypothetical protein